MSRERDGAHERVLVAVREVLGLPDRPIELHEPEFSGNEKRYVEECLDSTFVSSVGPFVDRFEAMLAEYTGAEHAVAVCNGTVALHVGLVLAGVRPGDEVLIPALSFVATANAVVHCGAVPHFVDCDVDAMGMDPAALDEYLHVIVERTTLGPRNRKTGRRLAAVVPMHTYGHPVEMESLVAVTERHDVALVEDAAESLGSTYNGQHTGTFGKVGVLSFNGNKIITTGGGGAILTNDRELARRAKHLTTTAKRAHRWEFFHDEVAWNYRLPNLNAALGCAQMERLPDLLERKRRLASLYENAFRPVEGIRFMVEPPNSRSNYWLSTIRIEPSAAVRDDLLSALHEAGYRCRPTWTLLSRLPMFTECPRAPLQGAKRLEASLVNLPSSPGLREEA